MRLKATESQTQRAILDLLAAEHIFAFRLNSAAFKAEGRFFRAHSLGRGAADILAFPVIRGILTVLWCEVKSYNGRQSPQQAEFEAFVTKQGHDYLLANSVDVVAAWLKEHGL